MDNFDSPVASPPPAAAPALEEMMNLENWALTVMERLNLLGLPETERDEMVEALVNRAEKRVLLTMLSELSETDAAEANELLEQGRTAEEIIVFVGAKMEQNEIGAKLLDSLNDLTTEVLDEYKKLKQAD